MLKSPIFESVDSNWPIAIDTNYSRSEFDTLCIAKARNCISILFSFIASGGAPPASSASSDPFRQSAELKIFDANLKDWTKQIVAVLLRVASVDDHRFVIFNAIRMNNISSWGTDLIQIPSIE